MSTPCGTRWGAQIVVPDNLKAAVSRPDRYESDSQPDYAELAQHYGVAIVPARAAVRGIKPKWRSACRWWNGGFSRACATTPSSLSWS